MKYKRKDRKKSSKNGGKEKVKTEKEGKTRSGRMDGRKTKETKA